MKANGFLGRANADAEQTKTIETLPETFDSFYRREYRSVVGLAYVLSGSWPAAEDLAQDTMIEVHRRWNRIVGYDNPSGWARRVLINKQRSRARRLASEAKALARLGGLPGSDRDPPVALGQSTDHMFSLVRELPVRQAQAIALQYWDDYTVKQIAEVMDCGTETVKTHLRRGRVALQAMAESGEMPL